MNRAKAVGAGMFIALGVLLFTAALFMIGERRMLFERRFPVYAEFASLGQLENGAIVRVSGLDAGEVTAIEIPDSPDGKFRVRMEVRETLHQLVRIDSVATTQTEGLVGGVFVNISGGTGTSPLVPDDGTIKSREPFQIADLLQQASDTVGLINKTVDALSDDAQTAVGQIAAIAEESNAMVRDIRPDLTAIARNGSQISADTRDILTAINSGSGTLGKLVKDDALYRQFRDIAAQAQSVMTNVRDVSSEARAAIADFRSQDGPAQGLMSDMRVTLSQAREATGDLADNMEALKRNFLVRGFFNRRGYYDLDDISPAEYRNGVLENGKRKAMRIWLSADVLFERGPDNVERLSEGGRIRLDSAMATYLEYLPSNPLVVEGYATVGALDERFRSARGRAGVVREYLLGRNDLLPQHTGYISLGDQAKGSPSGSDRWDGVAITLFLDRESLQFGSQPVGSR
jgi:phospholipid/cholesterol/gamma-HCH transport system substrate-binding protein